jgi:hypothetical protein
MGSPYAQSPSVGNLGVGGTPGAASNGGNQKTGGKSAKRGGLFEAIQKLLSR